MSTSSSYFKPTSVTAIFRIGLFLSCDYCPLLSGIGIMLPLLLFFFLRQESWLHRVRMNPRIRGNVHWHPRCDLLRVSPTNWPTIRSRLAIYVSPFLSSGGSHYALDYGCQLSILFNRLLLVNSFLVLISDYQVWFTLSSVYFLFFFALSFACFQCIKGLFACQPFILPFLSFCFAVQCHYNAAFMPTPDLF